MKRFAQIFAVVAFVFFTVPASAQKQTKSSWIAGVEYEGTVINVDLPDAEHIKNIGSKIDRAGMCVFSSIEMAARYQNLEQMRGWRDWCAAKYPGGGYPTKVDKLLDAWFKAKGIKPIPYLQYEGKAPEQIMELIDRTNRMASMTYGYSPRYGGAVNHMTNAVLYGQKYGVVLDNNFPRTYEWMLTPELVRRMRMSTSGGGGSAWVFVWLTPGSPPLPKVKR